LGFGNDDSNSLAFPGSSGDKKDEDTTSNLGFGNNDSLAFPGSSGDKKDEDTTSNLGFGNNDSLAFPGSSTSDLGTKDSQDNNSISFPTADDNLTFSTGGGDSNNNSSLSFPTGDSGDLAFPSGGGGDEDDSRLQLNNTTLPTRASQDYNDTKTSFELNTQDSNDTKSSTSKVETLGSSAYYGVANAETKYIQNVVSEKGTSRFFGLLKHFGDSSKQTTTSFVKNNLLDQIQEQITYKGEPKLTISECIRAGFIMTDISSRGSQLPSGVIRGSCEGDDSGCEATVCVITDSKCYVAQTGRCIALQGHLGSNHVEKISSDKSDPKSCFGNYRYKVEEASELRSVEPEVSVASNLNPGDFVLLVTRTLFKSLKLAGIGMLAQSADTNEALCKSLVSTSSSSKAGCVIFKF